jgi:hypothetical protein
MANAFFLSLWIPLLYFIKKLTSISHICSQSNTTNICYHYCFGITLETSQGWWWNQFSPSGFQKLFVYLILNTNQQSSDGLMPLEEILCPTNFSSFIPNLQFLGLVIILHIVPSTQTKNLHHELNLFHAQLCHQRNLILIDRFETPTW